MKQILPIAIFILAATTVNHLNVNSLPMVAPARHMTETNNLSNNQEFVSSTRPSIFAGKDSSEANPMLSIQAPVRETSTLSSPSSQTFDRDHSLQPRDSSLVPNLMPSSISNNTSYKRNTDGVDHDKIYSDTDMLSEGSGAGPLQSSNKNHRPKLDDTEDSGDDDGDDDEDYDYREPVDSGSGHNYPPIKTTERPKQDSVNSNIVDKKPSNDFYNPFRPPTTLANSTNPKQITNTLNQPEMTTRHVMTTRPPIRVGSTSLNVIITSTTYAPQSSSSTTSRNLVANPSRDNSTRTEVDYEYEDENDDEDSEETSAFEDNDSGESVSVHKSPGRQQSNSTITAQSNNSSVHFKPSRVEIPKQTINNAAGAAQPTRRPPIMVEPPRNTTQRYTTSRPNTLQITTRPAIHSPTSTQPTRLDNHSSDGDDLDDDEGGEDDEEEEEEDEVEEEDMEEDDREDESIRQSNTASVVRYNHSVSTSRPPTIESPSRSAPTISPNYHGLNTNTLPSIVVPSQEKNRPFGYHQTTARSSPMPSTSITPNQISSVPTISSTTTSVPTSPTMMQPDNTVLIGQFQPNNQVGGTLASDPRVLAGTARVPATSSPADQTGYANTFSSNTPSSRPPQVTTNIQNFDRALHDNGDTLTKQIYDKAVEVYQEADKTIRAAWQAIWPPNLNFDSTAVEPLLNQPLFFMLALGGTVIGLVLLMMLVVYIITYQIQPKDDDSSIY